MIAAAVGVGCTRDPRYGPASHLHNACFCKNEFSWEFVGASWPRLIVSAPVDRRLVFELNLKVAVAHSLRVPDSCKAAAEAGLQGVHVWKMSGCSKRPRVESAAQAHELTAHIANNPDVFDVRVRLQRSLATHSESLAILASAVERTWPSPQGMCYCG